MSTTILAVIFAAFAAVSIYAAVTLQEGNPALSPQQQAIVELACEYPTDGVLSWAESQGVIVNVRKDC